MLTRASVFVILNYGEHWDEFEVKLKKISSKFHFFLLSYLFFEKKQNIHAHISYTNESIDAKLGLDGHAYIHQYVNKLSDRLLLLLISWNTMASNSAKLPSERCCFM